MIRLFGKRPPSALDILRGAKWNCKSCEFPHVGMFDMAAVAPDAWAFEEEYEPNSAVRLDGDFLSEDFCVIGGAFFMVRCVLEIPVHDIAEKFAFGCWGSLKRERFEEYLDGFDTGIFADPGPWFSWLGNRLSRYTEGDQHVGCWMFPQPDRQRPVLRVEDPSHPLAVAQERGVEPDDILAIYHAYGHAVL